MKLVNQIKLNINNDNSDELLCKVAKALHTKESNIDKKKFKILHKSIDARNKNDIKFVYNIAVDFNESDKKFSPYVHCIGEPSFVRASSSRPIVVGFGPAGIFASYIFALNGIKPIILERGKSLDDRIKDTERLFKDMILDSESNVCFGEGGAGAFSDGKLNTNNKDKTGVYKFILETFVKFGADEKITYENLPHIGTDKLVHVIKNMRDEIIRLGGEIHYNSKFTYKEYEKLAKGGTPIILAIGNSSRDTFRDLIENGFDLRAKPFAIGYRIAHKQKMIDKAQYGTENVENGKSKILGPATYKLTYDVGNGHSIYSFCMCPGGYIINSSSSNGMLSINGMSYNDRAGKYANSAIVETIKPEDIGVTTAEGMIKFQEMIEKKAYELENGYIPYVVISGNASGDNDIFKGQAKCSEKLLSVYENLGLSLNINEDIKKALIHFNNIIIGFYAIDDNVVGDNVVLIAGVETRTSSPVTLDRDENYMCNVKNFYPCGEGLGHGGGIMSCAADGINVAMKILSK